MRRYDIDGPDYESEEGDWVRYEDVIAEINRLRERILDLEMPRRQFMDLSNNDEQ